MHDAEMFALLKKGPRLLAILAAPALLSACSFAPDYTVPSTRVPAAFKEQGIWTRGTPNDAIPRGAWWTIYADPVLTSLEARIEPANPTLAAALAHYHEAQGYLGEVRAAQFPSLDTGGHATTNKQSANRPLRSASQPTYYGDDLIGGALDYEVDLWGKVANAVAAGEAEAQSEAAAVADTRLALQAQLADYYFRVRGLDSQQALLNDTLTVYEKALTITQARHDKGIASGLDVGRAETQFEDAKTEQLEVTSERALLEHAIASLVGEPASSFSLAPAAGGGPVPNIPVGVPSLLLQRRPDVAAAERAAAAANANIGVARAAFFPDISLSAVAGFQNTGSGSLLTAPNEFWTLGPSIAMNLLDFGRRESEVQIAHAEYDAAAANYRAAVLKAFQDVEDNLSLLNNLAGESDSEGKSVESSGRVATMAMALYRAGAVSYLDVVTAQTTALNARLAALAIHTRQLEASVRLIQAVGGGWTAKDRDVAGTSLAGDRKG